MINYILRRLVLLIPVLIGMSLVVSLIIYAIPGDPAKMMLGDKASPESLNELRDRLGLDDPWHIQYFNYMGKVVQGDFGTSIKTKNPIIEEILPYLAATFELTLFALLIAVFFGMNFGIIAAWRQNSWPDYMLMIVALVGVSMPVFWLGLMEQLFFSLKLGWFPTMGRIGTRDPIDAITNLYLIDTLITLNWNGFVQSIRHLILPAFALATIPMAIIARISRTSMLEVMRSDYVRTAKAKGLLPRAIIYKHTLRNAFIPILTIIGLQMGMLLGGAVLTETIFSWPGVGQYIYNAISIRDYPVIQSGILMVATIFVLINLIVDILYAVIDPRITYN
jgi:peptide/nickel transport system permease protein